MLAFFSFCILCKSYYSHVAKRLLPGTLINICIYRINRMGKDWSNYTYTAGEQLESKILKYNTIVLKKGILYLILPKQSYLSIYIFSFLCAAALISQLMKIPLAVLLATSFFLMLPLICILTILVRSSFLGSMLNHPQVRHLLSWLVDSVLFSCRQPILLSKMSPFLRSTWVWLGMRKKTGTWTKRRSVYCVCTRSKKVERLEIWDANICSTGGAWIDGLCNNLPVLFVGIACHEAWEYKHFVFWGNKLRILVMNLIRFVSWNN